MTIEITDTTTGVVSLYQDEYWQGSFMWEEGNYACDCNRGLFHARGLGQDPDLDDYPCGRVVGQFEFPTSCDEDGGVL